MMMFLQVMKKKALDNAEKVIEIKFSKITDFPKSSV